MTEEELKERLLEIIADCYRIPYPLVIEQILTLIREAGWKSPSEIYELVADIQEKVMGQLKDAGWKSPEEVKEMNDIILFGPKSLR